MTLLIPLGIGGVGYIGPITTLIIALLAVVYFSYRQTIAAYPHGGGSYTVAKENLGTGAGLLAAAALMLDYVLVVAVGVSAGIGALVSALPVLQPYTLTLCLITLAMITIVNLRGVEESGVAFMAPTYLFVVSLLGVLAIGMVKTVASGGHPEPVEPPPALPSAAAGASFWILMRSFASGCTAMTGVEAVSNGVSAFREPAVLYARRTLTAIIASWLSCSAGIAYLCRVYGIGATEPGQPGYESVLSQLVAAVVGRGVDLLRHDRLGAGRAGAVGQHRLRRFPAALPGDRAGRLPARRFAHRGRRLVYSHGILVLAGLSGALAGHLRRDHRQPDPALRRRRVPGVHALAGRHGRALASSRQGAARRSMAINGLGAACTAVTLVVVLVSKFAEGAWITVLLVPDCC